MAKVAIQTLEAQNRSLEWAKQGAIVVGASLFVAIVRATVPCDCRYTRTTDAAELRLCCWSDCSSARVAASPLCVLPCRKAPPACRSLVPAGPGGIAQLFGPTGGYLMAYPFVASPAGWIYERTLAEFHARTPLRAPQPSSFSSPPA